jgi:hypothetical protein
MEIKAREFKSGMVRIDEDLLITALEKIICACNGSIGQSLSMGQSIDFAKYIKEKIEAVIQGICTELHIQENPQIFGED